MNEEIMSLDQLIFSFVCVGGCGFLWVCVFSISVEFKRFGSVTF